MDQTVRAAALRGFNELMLARNADPKALLLASGLPVAALSDDELRISLTAYIRLLEQASQLTGCPDLGLQMAQQQDISILGPIAIAMQNAATIREGLTVCARFLHTHSPGIRMSFHSHESQADVTVLRLTLLLPSLIPSRQTLDQCLADLYHFITWMAQQTPPVMAVHLPHSALAPLRCYHQVFEQQPLFEQAHAEIHLPSQFLEQDLSNASELLHQMSVDYLQLRYEPGNQTVSEQVEVILTRALSSTRGRRDVVAQLLSMHPRTLQRRLAAEGSHYQTILDDIRKTEIHRWLTETPVPLAQVAGLVGLADQTVLTRNCRRWFKATPAQIRSGDFNPTQA